MARQQKATVFLSFRAEITFNEGGMPVEVIFEKKFLQQDEIFSRKWRLYRIRMPEKRGCV